LKHKIEYLKLDKLSGYETNSRTHSADQINQIAASITEFGFTNPILIDENNIIIAGHGRLEAAKQLKLDEAPCLRLSHLSDAQKKAYVIADNKLALNAGWDDDLLKQEISDLEDLEFDIALLGFDSVELAKMFDEIEEQEIKEEKYNEVFNIIIDCKDEEEQERVFNRLDAEGYKCRVQSL
jgi:ParB-like chromosome segregation protein Spo0J